MWISSFEIASRRHDARCGTPRRRHARIAVQVPLPGRRFAQLPVPDGTGVARERRVLTPRVERLERVECVDRQDTFGDRIPNRVFESGQMLRLAPEARHRVCVPDQDDQLEGLLALWLGRLDPHSFPLKAWRRLLNRTLVTAGARLTEYRDPAGLVELRRAIADRLGPTRGIKIEPEQVIMVAGCQEGLNLTARLLLREGDTVAIENPAYQGAAYLYESYHTRLVPVRVDDCGLSVDDLPKEGAALLYITPSHQYPMGYTLTLERRLRLLDWAWRTGTYVVEDDYDSDFRYRDSPVAALMGLDSHDCVIYIGTFSKSLGPGLRLGYLVVPRHLAGPARAVKTLLDNGRPWLEQAVLSSFIATGGYTNHLRRIRQSYAERREHLMECLRRHFGETKVSGAECGMHIAWHLPQDLPRAPVLQTMAAERDVGIYTLRSGAVCDFGGCAYSERTILLGFSSLNERQIRRGVEGIAAAVDASHCCGGNV
ncbi:MAG: PLP-dependent aminotransferase family protein [Lautropia sp.]|nr:PLP-dependent aminotransferase family protein [Lautropia sp.]MDL1905982.1 PLP-dependent aminotransferase family protein [Betaproteobacteria bacterium PRO1]RIK91236.1 MAG: transcriptional regulator [Burkholderiales bacterium]